MSGRINSFDYIRVVSVIGILVVHSCNQFPEADWFGFFCACTFNFLFLILSAFLMGLSWNRSNRPPLNRKFIGTRMRRLSTSYYPYLVILFLFLYFAGDFPPLHKVFTHTLFLPWFDKIGPFRHLWYITLITICYFSCLIFSKLMGGGKSLALPTLIGGAVVALILDLVATRFTPAGYMFPYIYFYLVTFNYSDKIIAWLDKANTVVITSLSTVLLVLSIIYFRLCSGTAPVLLYLIGIVCASACFASMYSLMRNIKSSRPILWFCDISFEVYLVHMFFLYRRGVYTYADSVPLGFLMLLVCSIAAAYTLKLVSKRIRSLFNNI